MSTSFFKDHEFKNISILFILPMRSLNPLSLKLISFQTANAQLMNIVSSRTLDCFLMVSILNFGSGRRKQNDLMSMTRNSARGQPSKNHHREMKPKMPKIWKFKIRKVWSNLKLGKSQHQGLIILPRIGTLLTETTLMLRTG